MPGTKKFTDKFRKHTSKDEEILALEISEDRRLRNLGIDPDGDPIDIMIALETKAVEIEKERLAHEQKNNYHKEDKEQ